MKSIFLRKLLFAVLISSVLQSLPLLAPMTIATGWRWVHNPYSFLGIENVDIVSQGEVLELPITVPCSSHGSWADEVDAVDRVAEEVQFLGKDVYQNLETTPKAVEKFFSTEYVPLRDARDISPSSETGLSLESLDVATLEQQVGTNDDDNMAGDDLSLTRDVTTQAASDIVKTRSKKGKKKVSSNLGFVPSAKNDVKLAADSLLIDKEGTADVDGGKKIEPSFDTHEIKDEEAQWYTKGKKGKAVAVLPDATMFDSLVSKAVPKQIKSRQRKERRNASCALKGRARQRMEIDTAPLPSAQNCKSKKGGGRGGCLAEIDNENIDGVLAEFKAKCRKAPLANGGAKSLQKLKSGSSGVGLMYKQVSKAFVNNASTLQEKALLFEARGIPCSIETALAACCDKGFAFDPECKKHLVAAYILYCSIWKRIRETVIPVELFLLAQTGDAACRVKASAMSAYFSYFYPPDIAIDTALAAILDLGVKLCAVERLCHLEIEDVRFMEILQKYHDPKILESGEDYAVFLRIIINVGVLYKASPKISGVGKNFGANNRIKASFFTAVRVVSLCLDTDRGLPGGQCFFDLLLGELLDSVTGSIALLSFFHAAKVIEQKLSGEGMHAVCHTICTKAFLPYIFSDAYGVYKLGFLFSQVVKVYRELTRGKGACLKASYCCDLGLFELAEKFPSPSEVFADPIEELQPNKGELLCAMLAIGSFHDFADKFFAEGADCVLNLTASGIASAESLDRAMFGFEG